MSEILSQEEIDALLSTVSEEDIKDDSELDHLSYIPKKISLYDFRRPDRVSKEQLRAMRSLHDKFSRNFSSSLSNFLRTITDINLVSVDQMTYGEFLLSLPDPTSFNIISMIPLEGNIALEINPSLIYPMVDKLLGGIGEPLYKARDLTGLEQHIVNNLLLIILKDLQEIWKQVISNIKFRKEASENSPQIVQIVAQNEVIVLVVFEIKFGEVSGMMNICYPTITLEPILGKISSQDWIVGSRKVRLGENKEMILKLLEDISIPLQIILGNTSLPIEKILDLNKGDIILTEKKADEPVDIMANNLLKFKAQIGSHYSKKAVKIQEIL